VDGDGILVRHVFVFPVGLGYLGLTLRTGVGVGVGVGGRRDAAIDRGGPRDEDPPEVK
jgi:hypothetical protein